MSTKNNDSITKPKQDKISIKELIKNVDKDIRSIKTRLSTYDKEFDLAANYVKKRILGKKEYLTRERRNKIGKLLKESRLNGNINFYYSAHTENIDLLKKEQHDLEGLLGSIPSIETFNSDTIDEIYKKIMQLGTEAIRFAAPYIKKLKTGKTDIKTFIKETQIRIQKINDDIKKSEEKRKLFKNNILTQQDVANLLGVSKMTVSGHESGHSDEEDNVMNPSDQKTRVHKQNELVNWACYILKYALIYRVSPLYLIGNAADPNTYIPCKFKKGIRLTKESGNKTRKYKQCVRNHLKTARYHYKNAFNQNNSKRATLIMFDEDKIEHITLVNTFLFYILEPVLTAKSHKKNDLPPDFEINKQFLLMVMEVTLVERTKLALLRELMNLRLDTLPVNEYKDLLTDSEIQLKSPDFFHLRSQIFPEYIKASPFSVLSDFCKVEYDCLRTILIFFRSCNAYGKKLFLEMVYFYKILNRKKLVLDKYNKMD